ncbi:hypothetical protein DOY81_008730 [Sarcophaga bullata]|nr:hypothetical protein DOY81_008730 [Sarcophaga bullata]
MIKFCATIICLILALFTTTTLAQVDYGVQPSNHVTYYHYPAPPKALQFHAPQPNIQRSVNGAAQAYQNQYQYAANVESVQYNNNNNNNNKNYQTTSVIQQQLPALAKQFNSPALDNAAFNLALSSQGYATSNIAAVNAALTAATSRSNKTPIQSTAVSSTSLSSSQSSTASSSPQLASLNVKLPLPIGITPLNIAPLPLQAGAPYTAIPNGVTSYGTPYPQRKRR